MNQEQSNRSARVAKTPDNVFGRRLYEIRTRDFRIPNVETFAPLIGVTASTLENYEQGRSLPQGETPWRIYHLVGPELFASLMPHIGRPDEVSVPVGMGDDGKHSAEATVVSLSGTTAERLARLVEIAQQIAREE